MRCDVGLSTPSAITANQIDISLLVYGHDDLCLTGNLGEWADLRGIQLHERRPDLEAVANPTAYQGLVVLGSVESAYDDDIQRWFKPELCAVLSCIESNIPVLGICFGAQTLALALGGDVVPGKTEEIGWSTIHSLDPARIPKGPWMQWHHDTFSLPPGSTLLAENNAGVQAFSHGCHLGVQFHPEVNMDVLRAWASAGHADLARARIEPQVLLDEGIRCTPAQRAHAFALFDQYLSRILEAHQKRLV